MTSSEGNLGRQRRSVLLDRMWDRVEITRGESETALFYDLMFFGELLAKLVVLGLVSAAEPTRERHQYRLLHRLARANGVGEWAAVMEDLLTGPASAHLLSDAVVDTRELSQRFSSEQPVWQREAVLALQHVCSSIDPSRQISRGKVSLKTWFSDFAWLRNRTRGHGALKPTTCHKVVPDLERSMRLISENTGVLLRGWVHLRQNLSGKYRVSSLCGDTTAFDRLKSDPADGFTDGVYLAFGDQFRPVHLIETDADLTDVFIANGAFRATGQTAELEMLSYYTDSTRILDGSAWLLPPSELPPSETMAQPSMEVVGDSFTNLPAPVQGYVPRPELEKELLGLLGDDRHPVVTLVGRGGVGKTSVALSVLHELAQTGDFFALLWFSARDLDLLVSGAKPVTPDVLTKAEIATTFCDLMSPEWRREERFVPVDYLADSLACQSFHDDRLLFVFDNFETVRDPAELYTFIDSYIRLPNKVLITSRSRDFRGDYPVPVSGMTWDEFDDLIDSTASRLGISSLLTPAYRQSLFDEADGHPYVGKILLGEVSRTRQAGSIERIMASRDDVLNALFERTFNSISSAAQRVFLTLANWRSVVPRLALEAALLRPSNEHMDVAEALETLERSSLVELIATDERGEEFVRVPLAAYVFGQRKLRVSPLQAAVDADTEVIRLFGSAQRSEIGKGLMPRVRRMLGEVAQRQEEGRDVSDELGVLDYVARNYPPARLLLADFCVDDGRREDAAQAVSLYLEEVPEDSSAWLRLADLYQGLGDGRGEVFARVQAARLPKAPLGDISNAASTLNRHNFHQSSGLAPDESRSMAEEMVDQLASREAECDARDFSRLAWLYLHLNREQDARRVVELGLAVDSSDRHCVSLAERLGVGV